MPSLVKWAWSCFRVAVRIKDYDDADADAGGDAGDDAVGMVRVVGMVGTMMMVMM